MSIVFMVPVIEQMGFYAAFVFIGISLDLSINNRYATDS